MLPSGRWSSPFLRGNWEPVQDETEQALNCSVQGTVPAEIRGSFLRVGPNPARIGDDFDEKSYHFFSGDGLLHGVEFSNGEVLYRRRFVQTPHFLHGRDEADDGERGGLANTGLVFHSGRLFCLEEGSKPYEITLPTLDTVGRCTFGGLLRHNFTAHPKVCSSTGELMFFGYGQHTVEGSDAFIHYSVASPDGSLQRTVPIHFRKPTMVHDMAVTRHYSIFLDFPLWNMSKPTRVEDRSRLGVLPRHAPNGEEMQWFDAPGQYGYHVANAWERSASVIDLIIVAARDFSFYRSNLALKLHRFVFNLQSGETMEDADLCDLPCDFPIIDPRYVGLPSRFIWASRLCNGIKEPLPSDGLFRHDLHLDATVQLTFPEARRGGECQFVPRSATEGDGYLLVFTITPNGASELLILDASTMAPNPIAIVGIPLRVPYGFHALWVDATKYTQRSKL